MADLLAQLRGAYVALDEVVGERAETQTYMRALADAGFSEADQDLILSVARRQRSEVVIANQRGIHLVEQASTERSEKRFRIRTLSYSSKARTTRWVVTVLAAAAIAFWWAWDYGHQPKALEQSAQSLRNSESPVAPHRDDAPLEMVQVPLLPDLGTAPTQSATQEEFALPPVGGIQTCQEFITAEQSNSPRLLQWWLSGYVQRAGRAVDLLDTSSAIARLETQCLQHRTWKISKAIKSG